MMSGPNTTDGDVAEPGPAVDDDVLEIGRGGDFGESADIDVLVGAVDGAGGGVEGNASTARCGRRPR